MRAPELLAPAGSPANGDAVGGRPFDARLVTRLDELAHRGYTFGFFQRHPDRSYQNYLSGLSHMGRSP